MAVHMQQAMKHRKTLELVWNDLGTFDRRDEARWVDGGWRGCIAILEGRLGS